MDILQQVEKVLIEPLAYRGYAIVRLQMTGQKRKQLQIMIERLDDQPVTVDDCAQVSRYVSMVFHVEDVIPESYVLEISSPGLDRPLIKPKDFKRFQGSKVFVQTHMSIENRKRFIGLLESADDEAITLVLDDPVSKELARVHLKYEDIRSAKLYIEFNTSGKK